MTEIDPHDVQDSDFQNYFALETDTPTNFFRNSATSAFTDSFYTRPRLAGKLFTISDTDIRMTGTCKFTNIDGINRPVIGTIPA